MREKRITVTGGAGFLGRYVVGKLQDRGCDHVFVPRRRDYDLREKDAILRMYDDSRPDIVVHLAAVVGGIGANEQHPGEFFHDNAIMGIQLIESARRLGIEKFVCVGTICAYPKYTQVPFREGDLWEGYPEETNAAYGLAKKMLLVQLQAYRQQYGMNGIYLLPVNLYGPGDNFSPEYSHVIPAMIRKCLEAIRGGDPEIVLWGDGSPTREFLYAEDAAEGIVMATERYESPDPVNLGAGAEISIKELSRLIVQATGYKGAVVWDTSRPNGQPRRKLDTSRAKAQFGFEAEMPLIEGIERTIEWYRTSLAAKVAGN